MHDQGVEQFISDTTSTSNFKMKKKIGFWRGMSLICGCIIGAGIFVTPGGVLETSNGSIGLSLVVWIIGGVVAAFSALCYCEVTMSLKESGGTFTSINIAFGPMVGFTFAWMNIVAPFSDSTMLLSFGRYASEMIIGCSPPASAPKLLALLLMASIVYLNCISVRGSLQFQMICTGSKFIAIALIAGGGISMLIGGYEDGRNNFQSIFDETPLKTLDWSHFLLAFHQVMWPYMGWNALSYVYEEMKDAKKSFPLATLTALAIVTLLYLLFNVGLLSVLTPDEILSSKAVAATFSTKLFGNMSWLLPSLVCVCIIGSYNTNVLIYGRTTFAAARRGYLPAGLAMVNTQHHSPAPAMVVNCLSSIVLICIGDFDMLIEALGFVTWTFYGLNAASVLILRRKYPSLSRPFQIPTFVPVTLIIISIFFVVAPIVRNPHILYLYSIAFFGIGFIVYYVFIHCKWSVPGTEAVTLFCQKLFQIAPTEWDCLIK